MQRNLAIKVKRVKFLRRELLRPQISFLILPNSLILKALHQRA